MSDVTSAAAVSGSSSADEAPEAPPTPAQMLTGLTISAEKHTWTVDRLISRAEQGSGGHFSSSYIVHDENGTPAFLKAMDYAAAFRSSDPPAYLAILTNAFVFERNLLGICAGHNLSRIVRVIDEGKVEVTAAVAAPVRLVNFLVFELADGNISRQADAQNRLSDAVSLRVLHHVSVGLQQLHTHDITHQDVRPSNVLHFRLTFAKLADLGRASCAGLAAPHDGMHVAGFLPYAAPEGLYRADNGTIGNFQWRQCGDMFLFGSLLHFMFRGQMLMPQIRSKLAPEHAHENWTGKYDGVLPYLQSAFSDVLTEFALEIDSALAPELVPALKQLGEPDPKRRGHPRNIGRNQYSMERYISLLERLAAQAEWRFRRAAR